MKAEVLRGGAKEEFETQERCRILEVANDPDDEFVSIARARIASGGVTALHALRGVAERYLIVSGKGRVELGGQAPLEVFEGDVVRIPPGVAQRIANTGTGDLIFYCICTPPFRQDCYQALE
ncbi:MAG: cupin domain-containing protein [Deltaproteobacteria bacterium]|jgi:mannose-6-phosphate isomerase-like protein (cupin superfamily)|nr:cupin domain-containing protein [Deltaproteobacteria bacterium]MDA8307373.1 cupin domain-containing protein [Deltaproteobacteria bacterium]